MYRYNYAFMARDWYFSTCTVYTYVHVRVCRYRGTFVKRPYVWLGLGLQHTMKVCTLQCSVCTVKTKRRRVNLVHFF